MSSIPILVIQGPTASGKTSWALRLAERYPLEIISADSRQIYRGMDIGTAKVSAEERLRVPHHMIDIIDPDQSYSVADFVEAARPLAKSIHARGKLPCVVGGTGLYIRSLIGGLADLPGGDDALRQELRSREELSGPGTLHLELSRVDPEAAKSIHSNNLVKIIRALEVYALSGRRMSELQRKHDFSDNFFTPLSFAPDWPRETLYQRIQQRTSDMLQQGLVEETRTLLKKYGEHVKSLQTLGYREILGYLRHEFSLEEARTQIEVQTRRYAKRQLTWFRKEPETIWVDSCEESGRVVKLIDNLIQQ